MAVELDPLKPASRRDDRSSELIAECRKALGGHWKLISSSTKLRKAIFEAEYNGRRVIGKVSRSKRSQTAFGSMEKLREAGMRPPSNFTVPEPVAWLPDLGLLVQEKAPGESILETMRKGRHAVDPSVQGAAAWLQCLAQLDVSAREDPLQPAVVEQRAEELAAAIDDPRIPGLALSAIRVIGTAQSRLIPSHGDFHPMNIYVTSDRVTAIDLDTFALRECEFDIAYFLAQTANLGLLTFDSFDATRQMRSRFLDEFPGVNHLRVAAYMSWTLLQSLHFDACILKVGNEKAGVMIRAAERLLSTGSLD